ncbi:peptide/nickel transport system substrate-binding protein [Curtobacterium sp. PhB130]|uniref:ABC transporter substrate-binding protein n=1 Tax=unclassified Curtobacterium TaxID=257496 RepID=UPI000F4B0576|nr:MULTISPECIES: ABC transporter substrate-binding protein [unclassified Curtobacterium]ROS71859.1 peptide/nickel transport system substrate-binding protein [Curtobacterium sp. PhB130]TCK58253.1 peptide/nickel transport system substrate-binding protein [Curtobacterium sp. PhB136]
MKNAISRIVVMVAAATAVIVTLSGCTGARSTGTSGPPILGISNGGTGPFTDNFNPLSPTGMSGTAGFIYEPLFFFNRRAALSTKPVPLLGASYSWNSSGTVLDVRTQPGITWSDGRPFTAHDVAFTMNLLRTNPALDVSGGAPQATATDNTHVELKFDKPSFTLAPTLLGLTYIVPEHIWKQVPDPSKYLNSHPVGTGPLTKGSFTSQAYTLVPNKRFRDQQDVHVGGVRYYSLATDEVATKKLLAGQLDWAGVAIPNISKVLSARDDLSFSVDTPNQVVLQTCSNAALGCSGPQTDPQVRRAISAAIDRRQLNKLVWYGTAESISPTLLQPGRDKNFISHAHTSVLPNEADVQGAQTILRSAGWSKGPDGIFAKNGRPLAVTALVTSGYSGYVSALGLIQQQLKEAGIKLTVQQVAGQEANSEVGQGHFQLAINALFSGPVPDPYYLYHQYFASSQTARVGSTVDPSGNVTRFSDQSVDASLSAAGGTTDISQKAEAYASVQDQIATSMPYIPLLAAGSTAEFRSGRFSGFPDASNPYAEASPWAAPDNEQVLMHLRIRS